MPAGTIALTNKSATVAGTGTSFTTELKAGDFVYVNVGGAPYTLVAANITSDTQLTLAVAFDGPTTSGSAWNAVPASLQVAITQKILNDFASVARGRILDFQNWQAIYSDAASVTVTRPDRTKFTGPSWGYVSAQYSSKMDKSKNLSDVSDKVAAWKNIAQFGSGEGAAAQGNDTRLNTIDGKSGGIFTGSIRTLNGVYESAYTGEYGYRKLPEGSFLDNGKRRNLFGAAYNNLNQRFEMDLFDTGSDIQARIVSFNSGDFNAFYVGVTGCGDSKRGPFAYTSSDKILKEKIEDSDREGALKRIKKIQTRQFDWIDEKRSDRGFIAQELKEIDDRYAYKSVGSPIMGVSDRAIMADMIDVLIYAVSQIEKRDSMIEELGKRLSALDGLES
ncbi:tail fiber domain-containing protein [Pantoea ananatis]|uniref:tail fiber domain-containing protein n=1 Tax=Pantoea ananas TaxID=553 RepID=UPI001B301B57|nr:tail fiber domain-containing protein [Pantoea ananatis]